MQLPPLTEGRILRRYKRFLADVVLADGTCVVAHVPNTGRMSSCWAPGARVQLSRATNPRRKLAWTLERVHMGAGWVGVHTGRPNAVIAEGISAGRLPELAGYQQLRREVPYASGGLRGRFDLALAQGSRPDALVEIKNATLFDGERIRFPDALTQRGRKQLALLCAARKAGVRAIVLFAVNRPEGQRFSPAWAIDPDYSQALLRAVEQGVEVLAVRIQHSAQDMEMGPPLPLELVP